MWKSSEYRPAYIDDADAAVTFKDGPGRPGHRDPRRPRGQHRRAASSARSCRSSSARRRWPKVKDDLRRFKQRVETGEVPRSDGSPGGRAGGAQAQAAPRPAVGGLRAREGGCAMRANVWSGRNTVQVENVPDPKILNDRDAIVKITSTAICGSDLHLYDGYIPTMEKGDILGHEFMGEVVEVGRGVVEPQGRRPRRRAVPDRLRQLLGLPARAVLGVRELEPERRAGREDVRPPDGRDLRLLAPDRRLRGRAGGVRARALTPTSARSRSRTTSPTSRCCSCRTSCPTGFMGADFCEITGGEVIAVFGAGPVGQFAIASAVHAGRRAGHRDRPVRLPPRDGAQPGGRHGHDQLQRGRRRRRAAEGADRRPRAGRGHRRGRHGGRRTATASLHAADRVKQATRSESDRGHALRDAILACRPGGIVSIIGVYGGADGQVPRWARS